MDGKVKSYSVRSSEVSSEIAETMSVSFDDAKFLPAFHLMNQLSRKPIPFNDETKRFIEISAHIETMTDF